MEQIIKKTAGTHVRAIALRLQYAAVAVLRSVIRAYQLLLSPLLGPRCRFYPSCSEYSRQALAAHGLLRGTGLSIKRISRCHPGQAGGVDEVPASHTHECQQQTPAQQQ
ncbi:MAG: membrane protein insertion efficiency factor YidD [Pseudomonadales bacterium]|nr:membrane protein insertion efficiency factor YidD [Gammaproteobacteria bacterium]NNL57238.1 membrane protein insertion efficiency factor YidD [Pseudomonadales bacterium]